MFEHPSLGIHSRNLHAHTKSSEEIIKKKTYCPIHGRCVGNQQLHHIERQRTKLTITVLSLLVLRSPFYLYFYNEQRTGETITCNCHNHPNVALFSPFSLLRYGTTPNGVLHRAVCAEALISKLRISHATQTFFSSHVGLYSSKPPCACVGVGGGVIESVCVRGIFEL